MELKFAELQTPLFLAGTNLHQKLDPKKRQGMVLQYDVEHDKLLVTWNNETAIVPLSNVVSMVAGESPKAAPPPAPRIGVVKAQISTPTSHVFDGPGKGKK